MPTGASPSAAADTIGWHDHQEGMNLSSAPNESVLIDIAATRYKCPWNGRQSF